MAHHRPSEATWLSLCLAVAGGVVFYPLLHAGFVNVDDPPYVTANPRVLGGLTWSNMLWAFTTGHAGFWHPATWLSHMLDTQLFGSAAWGPHLTNILLHLANTVLFFLWLSRMTGGLRRSAFAAALFCFHPLRVESVAWVAERKDVLSAFFFMLTLWAYWRYVELSKIQNSKAKVCYGAALALFACGLMSKPMLVTVPCVLLLLDFWPLQRFQRTAFTALALEKIPFFLLTIAASVIAFLTQKQGGAVQSLTECPPALRLENVSMSYALYLAKTVWPVGLATPYPDPHYWPPLLAGAVTLVLAGVTTGVALLGKRAPFLPMGWLWFGGMLIPVIGLVQVGAQAMGDRFTYLPLIGIFIMVSWGAGEVAAQWRVPPIFTGSAALLLLATCAVRTRDQLQYWQNNKALLGHALAVTRNNWFAHYNLGWELDNEGQPEEAIVHYRQALAIKPFDPDVLNNVGCYLIKKKNYAEAVPYLRMALKKNPESFGWHYNLAQCLFQLKNFDEAIPHYQLFLQHNPEHLPALRELGISLALKGELAEAVSVFGHVLSLKPDDAEAHFNLGEALVLQRRDSEARKHLAEAVRLKPGWTEAQEELRKLDTNP